MDVEKNITVSIPIDELNNALFIVHEYILNVKKVNKDDFNIEYEEVHVLNDLEEIILRFSDKGEFLYDILSRKISVRADHEYEYMKNTYMFNVMSKHQVPKDFFGNDGRSFHLEIDKKTMRVIKELKFQ